MTTPTHPAPAVVAEREGLEAFRIRRVAALRPAGLTIGALAQCVRPMLANLADSASPLAPCGYASAWRLNGRLWCERCWWGTPTGQALAADLGSHSGSGARQ